jgi:2-C-methyl-D-erythritol 4-phosphate cytidylyltransferase
MQSTIPKQFLELLGVPIIIRTLHAIESVDAVDHVVVAAPPSHFTILEHLLHQHGLFQKVSLVEGGIDRTLSVRNALAHPRAHSADVVLVHDAVRPLASPSLFQRVIDATVVHGCVVPVVPVSDTIKIVRPDGTVEQTLDRSTLRAVQTPQGFLRDILMEAHANDVHGFATDDAALCEWNGVSVMTVAGEDWNIKITRPGDLRWASMFASEHKL